MSEQSDRRDLTLFEVEVLLKQTAKAEIRSSSGKSWLLLPDAIALLAALDYDADSVYLTNVGREFKILYRGDKVWLSPADGRSFTPCGWFTPRVLQKEIDESVYSTG